MNENIEFIVVDLFCGFGGVTLAFDEVRVDGRKIAKVIACVNHDPKAIQSHWMNHPEVQHFEEDIRTLKLQGLKELVDRAREKYPNAKVILWASAECTNLSNAKGGMARDPDSRTLSAHLFRYCRVLQPDYFMMENVREFRQWGRKDSNGKPIKKYKGESWNKWRNWILDNPQIYGFVADRWEIMNAADYGAITVRPRLFGIFAKEGLPIAYPLPTHAKNPEKTGTLHGKKLKRWRAVREVLQLDSEGISIFGRKPRKNAPFGLSLKTFERLYAGLLKFVAEGDTSFLTTYYSGNDYNRVHSLDEPSKVVTTANRLALVKTEHFIEQANNSKCPVGHVTSLDKPSRVLTKKGGNLRLVTNVFLEKFLEANKKVVKTKDGYALCFIHKSVGNNQKTGINNGKSIDDPSIAVTTQVRQDLVHADFICTYNNNPTLTSLGNPSPVVTTKDRLQKVKLNWIDTQYSSGQKCRDVDYPAGTITTVPKMNLVTTKWLDKQYSGKDNNQSIDKPAGVITCNPKFALCHAILVPTNYKNKPVSIDEPAPVITANRKWHYIMNPQYKNKGNSIDNPSPVVIARNDKRPLHLVTLESGELAIQIFDNEPEVIVNIKKLMAYYGIVDVKIRMLFIKELLKIQGFPEDYKYTGTQEDAKKFVGNSVEVNNVMAWVLALYEKLQESKQHQMIA